MSVSLYPYRKQEPKNKGSMKLGDTTALITSATIAIAVLVSVTASLSLEDCDILVCRDVFMSCNEKASMMMDTYRCLAREHQCKKDCYNKASMYSRRGKRHRVHARPVAWTHPCLGCSTVNHKTIERMFRGCDTLRSLRRNSYQQRNLVCLNLLRNFLWKCSKPSNR